MNYSNYRFTLDIQKNKTQASIPVHFGDTGNRFYIALTDGGNPYIITDGCRVDFYAKKPNPNSAPLVNSCIIENNSLVRYDFNTNTADQEGIHKCELRLYSPDGRLITTPSFIMVVDQRVVYDDEIATDEEAAALNALGIIASEQARVDAEAQRAANEVARATAMDELVETTEERLDDLIGSAYATLVNDIHINSMVIGEGTAAKYSIAGGTKDKAFIQELAESQYGSLGGWASSFITLEPSKAEAAFSISLGANNTSSASGAITYGFGNKGEGWSSVALGASNETTGAASLAYGYKNKTTGDFGVALGDETVAGEIAFAGGVKSQATKKGSFAFGNECKATGEYAVSIGADNTAKGNRSFACGSHTRTEANYAHAEGNQTKALGHASHAEGELTEAKHYAHAEGYNTKAHGNHSHAEGSTTEALGQSSHTEGWNTKVLEYAEGGHAEGYMSIAKGEASHAEGSAFYYEGRDVWNNPTTAEGFASHAEGMGTTASGEASHAEGQRTTASGKGSHAGGHGTIASADYQTAIGTHNEEDADAILIVGNGTADNNRSNAFKVKKDGTGYLGGEKIATKTETWTFTLEDGSTVEKEVYIK